MTPTGNEIGMITLLTTAIGAVWKMNMSQTTKLDAQRKEEKNTLLDELKSERDNGRLERKEYQKSLANFNKSLNDNTQSIRENTTILQEISKTIPLIKEEVKTLGDDIEKIKEYVFVEKIAENNKKD